MATTFEFYKTDQRGLLKSCLSFYHQPSTSAKTLNQQQTGSISLDFSQTLCYNLCNKIAKLLIKK